MKKRMLLVWVGLVMVSLLTACNNPPSTDLADARAALDAVIAAGAEQYAPEALARINNKMDVALKDIEAQKAFTFRDYSLAKFNLIQVYDDSNQLRAKIAEMKGEPKVVVALKAKPFAEQ